MGYFLLSEPLVNALGCCFLVIIYDSWCYRRNLLEIWLVTSSGNCKKGLSNSIVKQSYLDSWFKASWVREY